MLIITNNPKVSEFYKNEEVLWVDGGYLDVLLAVRDSVHAGDKLLTHPLAGSLKPNQTPFRSIALEHSSKMDFGSLDLIEKALQTLGKFLDDFTLPTFSQRIKNDFSIVDFSFLHGALKHWYGQNNTLGGVKISAGD